MDLNQTFCASDCQNFTCKKMISYSKLCAAESNGVQIKHSDQSADCKDYKPINKALEDPLWKSHMPDARYAMLQNGKPTYGEWRLIYYPVMGDGATGKSYDEPRALLETRKMYGSKEGLDFREVPIRYIQRIDGISRANES